MTDLTEKMTRNFYLLIKSHLNIIIVELNDQSKVIKGTLVIQEWLKGKTRDKIAKETGISQGTVTG